ncbi:MAG: DUF481 domain-containing protein [Planctomycetota bacterium]|jgi:putative salt-induced outer membrane protein YdiY
MRMIFALLLSATAVIAAEEVTTAQKDIDQAVHHYLAQADEPPPNKLMGWELEFSLGLTITEATTSTTTFAYQGFAKREKDKWIFTIRLTGVYAETESVETANEHILVTRADYKLDAKSALFGEMLFEHDGVENISFRWRGVAGYTRTLTKKERFEMFGDIGAGVLYEDYQGPASSLTDPVGVAALRFTWQITEVLSYRQLFELEFSLDDFGEGRVIIEANFDAKLSKQFSAVLNIRDTYNSRPTGNAEKNQLVVQLMLSYKY